MDAFDTALGELHAAYHRAHAAAHELCGVARFGAVTRLMRETEQMMRIAAADRPQVAADIRDDKALSLAGLAEQISVSKARAQQLVETAKQGDPHAQ